jgi:hypothetical protein
MFSEQVALAGTSYTLLQRIGAIVVCLGSLKPSQVVILI